MRGALLIAAALLAACNQVNVCSWRTATVVGDAGAVSCVHGEDCPRDGTAPFVCPTNVDEPDVSCVRCTNAHACERIIAVQCP